MQDVLSQFFPHHEHDDGLIKQETNSKMDGVKVEAGSGTIPSAEALPSLKSLMQLKKKYDAPDVGSLPEGYKKNSDKEWLQTFIKRDLLAVHSKYEAELNHIRNKKKGGAKKNKEKTQSLVNKLADLKKVKERADELNITMDYLDPGRIKTLKDATKVFLK